MDVRNVQRTGKMHYIYLPTDWCRKHAITADSKLLVEEDSAGNLLIQQKSSERKPRPLSINLKDEDIDVLQKLIMACYINPASSFHIHLDKEMDLSKLLQQKRLISVELIEAHGKTILCESTVTVDNPESLLRTLVRKIKNLLLLMQDTPDPELISKYEEEIDRTKILIEKAVITAFTVNRQYKLSNIDMYYTALISKTLERTVDHLIRMDQHEKPFFSSVTSVMDALKDIVDGLGESRVSLDTKKAIDFTKLVSKLPEFKIVDVKSYGKRRIRSHLMNISEVLLDWAITNELSK